MRLSDELINQDRRPAGQSESPRASSLRPGRMLEVYIWMLVASIPLIKPNLSFLLHRTSELSLRDSIPDFVTGLVYCHSGKRRAATSPLKKTRF
jgi:hypothetical protein